MSLGLSTPGGAEIVFMLIGTLFLVLPVLAVIYYLRANKYKKEINILKEENRKLLDMLVDQSSK